MQQYDVRTDRASTIRPEALQSAIASHPGYHRPRECTQQTPLVLTSPLGISSVSVVSKYWLQSSSPSSISAMMPVTAKRRICRNFEQQRKILMRVPAYVGLPVFYAYHATIALSRGYNWIPLDGGSMRERS